MNLKVSVIVPAYNAEHMVSASKHDVVTASSIPDIL